jgi:hypothetical protein
MMRTGKAEVIQMSGLVVVVIVNKNKNPGEARG